jgi:hypothetical protein
LVYTQTLVQKQLGIFVVILRLTGATKYGVINGQVQGNGKYPKTHLNLYSGDQKPGFLVSMQTQGKQYNSS